MAPGNRGNYYFLFGVLILLPINIEYLGTQIFPAQTILVVGLLSFMYAYRKGIRIRAKGSLEVLVYAYFCWAIATFVLNLIFSMDELALQGRRLLSLGISLLFFSGFFIGKSFKTISAHSDRLVKGICLAYLGVLCFIAITILMQDYLDLYVVRRIFGQRLPFVIAFVSVIAMVYFFDGHKRNILYLLVFISGTISVVLSLTRAAYIQLFVSVAVLFWAQIRRYFFWSIFVLTIFLTISTLILFEFRDSTSVRQVSKRVELLLDVRTQSTEDDSGVSRLAIWRNIGLILLDDPIRLVIGFGQLGPSQLSGGINKYQGGEAQNAHSQYLDIIVREGIVGLILFLTILYKSIKWGLSASSSVPTRIFIYANSIGILGLLCYGFFHETFRYPLFGFYFWVYLGILSETIKSSNEGIEAINSNSSAS